MQPEGAYPSSILVSDLNSPTYASALIQDVFTEVVAKHQIPTLAETSAASKSKGKGKAKGKAKQAAAGSEVQPQAGGSKGRATTRSNGRAAATETMPTQLLPISADLVEKRLQDSFIPKSPTKDSGKGKEPARRTGSTASKDKGKGKATAKEGPGNGKETATNPTNDNGESGSDAVAAAADSSAADVPERKQKTRANIIAEAQGLSPEEMLTHKIWSDEELAWLNEAYGLRWIKGRFTKAESENAVNALFHWGKVRGKHAFTPNFSFANLCCV